jgi:hypothetical protein
MLIWNDRKRVFILLSLPVLIANNSPHCRQTCSPFESASCCLERKKLCIWCDRWQSTTVTQWHSPVARPFVGMMIQWMNRMEWWWWMVVISSNTNLWDNLYWQLSDGLISHHPFIVLLHFCCALRLRFLYFSIVPPLVTHPLEWRDPQVAAAYQWRANTHPRL